MRPSLRTALALLCAAGLALPATALGAGSGGPSQQGGPAKLTEAQAKERLAQAERLQSNGFEEEARKVVQEVVQSSEVPIPKKLRSPEQRLGWWREWLGVGGPVLRTGLEIVAVLLAVLLVGLLIATMLNALVLRFHLAARLEGFSGSDDATVAPLLGAALSEALERMSDDRSGRKLTWTSGTEAQFELPSAITEAVPTSGVLAGLVQMLDKVLYRNLCLVSGTVHPPHEHRGAGVTLVLANRSGSESEEVTVWESEFMLGEAGRSATDAVRFERLILPAAIWLGYRPKLRSKKDYRPPLGAREWRSYALFALGELVPDPKKQRVLYERALDIDEANVGARLNLADLLLQRREEQMQDGAGHQVADNGSRESWQEQLELAGSHLQAVADSAYSAEQPIWYRGRYMEAIRRLYLAQLEGRDPAQESASAKDALKELSDAIASNAGVTRLQPLFGALRWPVEILSASIEVIGKTGVGDLGEIDSVWLSANGQYNLACYWARRARAAAPASPERQQATASSVRALRRALARDDDMLDEARVDPAFDAIRDDPGFTVVVPAKPDDEDAPVTSSHYAITLDPGPQLTKLFSPSGA